MAKKLSNKQAEQSYEKGKAFDDARKAKQISAADAAVPVSLEDDAQGAQSLEGVELAMQTLRNFVDQYAYVVALFSLNEQLEYCLTGRANAAVCVALAKKRCEQGYFLVGIAGSQDFGNWEHAEIRMKGCPHPRGFVTLALDVIVSLVLSGRVALSSPANVSRTFPFDIYNGKNN